MKILLLDLDVNRRRHLFPNLALMKLSAYHKAKGDEVWLNFPLCQPDITYASCVFSWNKGRVLSLTPDVIKGGAGINYDVLPPEIEHIKPDYSLYPGISFSLGFTSRGCIRKCPWCIVPQKEGYIQHWARWYEFWDRRHKKVLLLDNNFLASPFYKETLRELIMEGVEVDFNQGLDIRLLSEENVALLKRVKTKQLRFAFDDMAYEKALRKGIELMINSGLNPRRLSFYLLVGFPGDETAIERMKILASYNVDVYPMVYKGVDGKEPKRRILYSGDILWHGNRRNINKFLRLVGRLPE